MLPTFVIGLREGLEAALIVGIVAAFLRQQGRKDVLRSVWAGVALAVGICAAVGLGLELLSRQLPYREQEGLETIVGFVAVAAVTFMVVWMRRHARGLKRELEHGAASALAQGSVAALVGMAFFAVIREGFETAVFMLAAFDASDDPALAGTGAVVGVLVSVLIGWGIYRGGVRINLTRFFRVTGVVLVLVAAGVLATAFHTGHEAGWVNAWQSQAFDLTWFVDPGSIRSALLTGMFGFQPRPTVIEAVVYVAFALPMLVYVLTPPGTRLRIRRRSSSIALEQAT
jgi:high-affinity iron transporter